METLEELLKQCDFKLGKYHGYSLFSIHGNDWNLYKLKEVKDIQVLTDED